MNLIAKSIAWDLGRDITHEVLIANLGGYEAAKRYAESRNGADNTGVYDLLQAALLEYRRANNIYEVGDKVVYRTLPHERLFYVKAVLNGSIVVRECWDELGAKCFSEFDPYDDIQHATDAEIEAGKRLEVV